MCLCVSARASLHGAPGVCFGVGLPLHSVFTTLPWAGPGRGSLEMLEPMEASAEAHSEVSGQAAIAAERMANFDKATAEVERASATEASVLAELTEARRVADEAEMMQEHTAGSLANAEAALVEAKKAERRPETIFKT